jgi:hypothetical protein
MRSMGVKSVTRYFLDCLAIDVRTEWDSSSGCLGCGHLPRLRSFVDRAKPSGFRVFRLVVAAIQDRSFKSLFARGNEKARGEGPLPFLVVTHLAR